MGREEVCGGGAGVGVSVKVVDKCLRPVLGKLLRRGYGATGRHPCPPHPRCLGAGFAGKKPLGWPARLAATLPEAYGPSGSTHSSRPRILAHGCIRRQPIVPAPSARMRLFPNAGFQNKLTAWPRIAGPGREASETPRPVLKSAVGTAPAARGRHGRGARDMVGKGDVD